MVQLTTTYDKTLKEKVFVLKGMEGYARTTDTVLEEIFHESGEGIDPETGRRADWNHWIEHMLVEFRINVLRDQGEGQITLYDGEETIGVYQIDTNSHSIELAYDPNTGIDNRIPLRYGVEHNIYAKYMGNKQCLKSESKKYTFFEELPPIYVASLSFNGLKTSYELEGEVTFKVKLSAEEYFSNKNISIYLNDKKVTTVTTDSNGEAPVQIENLTQGLHTIRAVFEGTDNLGATSTTQEVNVGYLVYITDCPSYVINGEPSSVTVKVTDYRGVGITDSAIVIQEYIEGWGWETISQVGTTRDGYVTLKPVYITENEFKAVSSSQYSSEPMTVVNLNKVKVSALTVDKTIISNGYSTTITGSLSNVAPSYTEPVTVSFDNGIGDVVTDSYGNFTAKYTGTGKGDTTITASVYKSSSTVTVEDVMQYWDAPNNIINQKYTALNGMPPTAQSNGWLIEGRGLYRLINLWEVYDNVSVSFKVISQTGVTDVGWYYDDTFHPTAQPVTVTTGDRVELRFSQFSDEGLEGWLDIYKNGNIVESGNVVPTPWLSFVGNSNGFKILIDELKVKRI